MKKAVLLDFDGVINVNNNINNKVANLSVKYLSKELNVSYKRAESLNRIYYPTLGHTCKTVDYIKRGKQNISTESLKRYNEFVFNNLDYDKVLENIYEEEKIYINNFFKKISEIQKIADVYIFTNAPKIWCDNILKKFKLDNVISEDKLITSDKLDMVKPSEKVYFKVHSDFLQNYSHIFFIDDAYKNLIIPQKILNWKGIYYSGHNSVMAEQGYNSILVSKNLDDIINYVRYYTNELEF